MLYVTIKLKYDFYNTERVSTLHSIRICTHDFYYDACRYRYYRYYYYDNCYHCSRATSHDRDLARSTVNVLARRRRKRCYIIHKSDKSSSRPHVTRDRAERCFRRRLWPRLTVTVWCTYLGGRVKRSDGRSSRYSGRSRRYGSTSSVCTARKKGRKKKTKLNLTDARGRRRKKQNGPSSVLAVVRDIFATRPDKLSK